MKNHTDLINYLIRSHNLKSYLEIGVNRRSANFDLINAQFRIGVDPESSAEPSFLGTSDEFFAMAADFDMCFDIVFIDGLHHRDQVKRDFDNSLKLLSPGGVIVLHDTCPEVEYLTHVPRDKKGRWLGDVYKFICQLNEYDGIDFCTLDFDNGCTLVWKDVRASGLLLEREVTWNYYLANKISMLRIIPMARFTSENIAKVVKS